MYEGEHKTLLSQPLTPAQKIRHEAAHIEVDLTLNSPLPYYHGYQLKRHAARRVMGYMERNLEVHEIEELS